MSWPEIVLLRPWWLLALPVLGLLTWLLWRRSGALGDWARAADPALLRAMERLGHVDRASDGNRMLLLFATSAALMVLGLAGPAVERRDTLSFRNLDGVIFAVDASASVTEDAGWEQLLLTGRFALSALGTRPGGIVVYAGDAYVASDLTNDHLQLGQTFSLIGPQTVPDPGSRPERALALAADRLETSGVIAGDVLLFTDGAGLGPASLLATERLAGLDARLSLVGLHGATPEMEAHARLGNGRVFAASEVEALGRFLSETAPTRLEMQQYPMIFWRDMGRYLLVAAMVPVCLLFRRGNA
ncbi:VWA domain-containing protein [Sulfitobacter sp. LCG007]